jgi:hypothetical protein
MIALVPQLGEWIRGSEDLLRGSLVHPGPTTLALVFLAGLLTSLGPCSLSLLPVTLAYLAGFGGERQPPWTRSVIFAAGIVVALVSLGLVSGLMGRLYGRVPDQIPPFGGCAGGADGSESARPAADSSASGSRSGAMEEPGTRTSGSPGSGPGVRPRGHPLHNPCSCCASGLDGPERQPRARRHDAYLFRGRSGDAAAAGGNRRRQPAGGCLV